MDIKQATSAYETWLEKRIPLLKADLKIKHQRMTETPFQFLRATFYRWSQLWPERCPEFAGAPPVLGVGDLHLANFGTWRDSEGRLIWGVNDFDEASRIPFAVDLVRLAVSARLASPEQSCAWNCPDICAALLDGYLEGIQHGGAPFVLAEHHGWLRQLASIELRDPVKFWDKLNQWPVARQLPPGLKTVLTAALPGSPSSLRVIHRPAGLGSLGRRRFTAIAEWGGGFVAREAKELALSAWTWDAKANQGSEDFSARIMAAAIRVPDPTVSFHQSWLIRRLAPDCSRIEASQLPQKKDAFKLLRAMGLETANIHLGTKNIAKKLLADLHKRPPQWLCHAAQVMEKATLADWKRWREK